MKNLEEYDELFNRLQLVSESNKMKIIAYFDSLFIDNNYFEIDKFKNFQGDLNYCQACITSMFASYFIAYELSEKDQNIFKQKWTTLKNDILNKFHIDKKEYSSYFQTFLIGSRFKKIRLNLKISELEMAKLLNIDSKYLKAVEFNGNQLSSKNIFRFLNIGFNNQISISEFFKPIEVNHQKTYYR